MREGPGSAMPSVIAACPDKMLRALAVCRASAAMGSPPPVVLCKGFELHDPAGRAWSTSPT